MGPRFANGSGRNSSSNDIWWNRNDNKGTITDHTIATDGHTLKNLDIGANKKLTGRAEAARVFILQRFSLTATRMRGPVERLVGAYSLWI